MSELNEEEIIKYTKNIINATYIEATNRDENGNIIEQGLVNKQVIQGLLDLYQKEKEKNTKAIEMLQEHIKHCEQEAKGSLNNKICHIALKFDKHLLKELLEERN